MIGWFPFSRAGMSGWTGCCGYSLSQVRACLVHPRPVDDGFDLAWQPHPVDSRLRGNDGPGLEWFMSSLLFRQVMCICSLSSGGWSDQSNG